MELKIIEGCLGKVDEFNDDLSGLRIWHGPSHELRVDAVAVGHEKQAILISRFRLTYVHGTGQRAFERGRVERERPDLGVIGTICRHLSSKVGLRICTGALSVGSIGINGKARRQLDNDRPKLRRRRGQTEKLRCVKLKVQPRS
jgi:hypothetical protein